MKNLHSNQRFQKKSRCSWGFDNYVIHSWDVPQITEGEYSPQPLPVCLSTCAGFLHPYTTCSREPIKIQRNPFLRPRLLRGAFFLPGLAGRPGEVFVCFGLLVISRSSLRSQTRSRSGVRFADEGSGLGQSTF